MVNDNKAKSFDRSRTTTLQASPMHHLGLVNSTKQNGNTPNFDDQSFSSIVKDYLKLKIDFRPLEFKRNKIGNYEKTDLAIYKLRYFRCNHINTGENVMFRVTFSCQDSQPDLDGETNNNYVEKSKIKFPERTMPIDCIRIQVEFFYKDSISELTKYTKLQTEEEIINSLITIIDVDDHQVYFKLRTNYFNTEHEPEDRFIVIGKMDHSQHAFIFDMSEFSGSEQKLPRNLKQMYECCLPSGIAKYFSKSTKDGNEKISNSDKSIIRVGFGMYFRADTTPKREITRFSVWGNTRTDSNKSFIRIVNGHSKFGDYGLRFLAESGQTGLGHRTRYKGVINVGYYSFKASSWFIYDSFAPSYYYTCKLIQEVKYKM